MKQYRKHKDYTHKDLATVLLNQEGVTQKELARREGISQAAISLRLKRLKKNNSSLQDLLIEIGITNEYLSKHAFDGLNATKIISAAITYGEADEKTNDFIEVPDWNVRHKYFETILELKGLLIDKPSIDQSKHSYFVIFRNPKAIAEEKNNIKCK